MYYQLHDTETEILLGAVKVTNATECCEKEISHSNEISESWTEFNQYEETELDYMNVDDFVVWHNENRVTQLERIYFEICQP
jgi:hypothetical protein